MSRIVSPENSRASRNLLEIAARSSRVSLSILVRLAIWSHCLAHCGRKQPRSLRT